MKYKVGDKVQIKSFDWYYKNRDKIGQVDCGKTCFALPMVTFCGQIVTISSILPMLEVYRIKEDDGEFNWTDEMIERLAERNGKTYPYKIGDRVVLKGKNKCAIITDLKYDSFGNLSYYINIDNDKDNSISYPTDLLLPYDNKVEGLVEEKTKPKFKVGDRIITDTNMKGKIIEDVEEGWYRVEFESYNNIPQPNGIVPEESMSLAEEESEKKLSDESWKPSKEEMDVLYGLAYITNQYDEHKEEIITRLYQDLKREFFNGSSYENMFPNTENDVRRRSTIQVLEYARSLDNYNQYGKADIDKNIAWLEKQGKIQNNMNENIDLTKILEGCPKGTKFYSSDFGEVTFFEISPYDWEHYPIRIHYPNEASSRPLSTSLTKNGQNVYGYDGECTLFPSKTQRDWSKFVRFWDKPKVEKFDVNTLQPFDKVLVRDDRKDIWGACLFSHPGNNLSEGWFVCDNTYWHYIIPYNDDTKHLVGTREDCPEYYKWWEE